MTLLAAVLHLAPEQALPPWLGRAAQSWLLNAVRLIDPALARAQHVGTARRPYTISAPRGTPGDYWLRITSLSPDLTAALKEAVLPAINSPLRLANTNVSVTSVELGGHPWAGQSDFETLARQALDADIPHSRFGLEFATPTAFHHDGWAIPLPLPALVYGSLIQAWDLFSPAPLPVPLLGFVENHVGIARHRIATHMVQFGDSERHIGFTGTTGYILRSQELTGLAPDDYRQRAKMLDLLTQFAFYAGVGVRTAVGMGQARPVYQQEIIT